MTQHLPGVPAGVSARDQVQHGQPQVVAEHDDQNDLQEGGELVRDHALVAQAAEGGADVKGEQGDDDALHDLQHDILELLKQIAGKLALRPYGGQTDQQGEGQRAHDGHDLGDVELKDDRGQLAQTGDIGHDGQMGDQDEAGGGAHEGGADRAEIGDDDGYGQHAGCIAAHAGDGRGDKADDDQRDAEHDELAQHILQRHDDLHRSLAEDLAETDADQQRDDEPEGKTCQDLFHNCLR